MKTPMKTMDDERLGLMAYAWPGGYPIYYLARDGWREDDGRLDFNPHDRDESVCCPLCAVNVTEWPDLIIVAQDIHYEGEPLQCEWCNERIESAYGDPDAEEEAISE